MKCVEKEEITMIRANYESDAGNRKEVPPEEYGTVPHISTFG
jgi:hypothetical protein